MYTNMMLFQHEGYTVTCILLYICFIYLHIFTLFFHFILFYFILFYFILFCVILFYLILFYFILFHLILYLLSYCQAQLQLSAQLKAELVLFPLDPATHPPVKVYF